MRSIKHALPFPVSISTHPLTVGAARAGWCASCPPPRLRKAVLRERRCKLGRHLSVRSGGGIRTKGKGRQLVVPILVANVLELGGRDALPAVTKGHEPSIRMQDPQRREMGARAIGASAGSTHKEFAGSADQSLRHYFGDQIKS